MDMSCGELLSTYFKDWPTDQMTKRPNDQLAKWLLDWLLTLSGLPLIPVTSLTGMLKKEVSFLSWLIVIWVKV